MTIAIAIAFYGAWFFLKLICNCFDFCSCSCIFWTIEVPPPSPEPFEFRFLTFEVAVVVECAPITKDQYELLLTLFTLVLLLLFVFEFCSCSCNCYFIQVGLVTESCSAPMISRYNSGLLAFLYRAPPARVSLSFVISTMAISAPKDLVSVNTSP